MTLTRLKLAALLLAAGLLAAGGLLAGTATEPDTPRPPAGASDDGKGRADPPSVRLVRAQPGGLDRVISQPATAEPARQADLYPLVAGQVKAVKADLGERVKAGQLLAEIDAPSLALDERAALIAVDQSQGLLREAESRVVTAEAEVGAAKSAIRQREVEATAAQANLTYRKKQYERLKDLVEQKSVDVRLLDESNSHLQAAQAQTAAAAAAVENAKSDLEVKKGKLAQAEAAVASAKSNVDAAKIGLEKVRLSLAQTKVAAPFDGVVTRCNVAPGDSLRPDSPGAARPPLFTVVRVDVIRVVVQVPDREAPLADPGVGAEVVFDALPGVKLSGKVARVAFATDPTTRTMRAEIDVPNPDGKIRPGMFGAATLKLGKGPADAVRVPASAAAPLSGRADGMTHRVYVYRDGKARLTPVRATSSNGSEVEIVAGLTAKDQVVVDPKGLQGHDVPVRADPTAPSK